MIIGQYYTKIDNKGRTALPAKFRKELGEELIVCRWYESSLAVFGKKAWINTIDVAVGESLMIAPTRDTERFLLGGAFEIAPDSQGRIILPQALRVYAQLVQDIVFLGLQNRLEIWGKDNWEKREREIISAASELIEEVQKIKVGQKRQ
jgi:MraZ protein